MKILFCNVAIAVVSQLTGVNNFSSGSFTPFVDTYNSGSGNETIPIGSSSVTISGYSGGGGGATNNRGNGYGGGGGAYSTKVFTVSATDWGQQIPYVVGTGGSNTPTAGGNSTIGNSGFTINSVTCNISTIGGGAGSTSVGGAGGTASGGTTNTSGQSGSALQGGDAGNATGTGGGQGINGASPGGGGGGNSNNATPGSGANGRIIFNWS